MKILVLSQYYTPEPIPKPHDLAVALRQKGHSVYAVTGIPNYPSGRVYEGYKAYAMRREMIDEIRVIRTFEFPYHGGNLIGRILNYASFMLSAPFGALFGGRCDVIYVWHPPLTMGVAAWLISKIKRAPFVYDVQDIWPESAVLAGVLRDGPMVRLMGRLAKFVYRRAAHILVPTEGARENILSKGVPPEKVTTLPHWVDETMFDGIDPSTRESVRVSHGWNDEIIVLFAGNLGFVQGLDTVVEAAGLVGSDRIRFVFAGDGADRERLESLVRSKGVSGRVSFLGHRPMEEMPGLMAASDLLLVHLKRSELSKLVIPSKTMAYLAAGKPILMAMEGAAADMIAEAGAGKVCEPGDPVKLAAAVEEIVSMPAEEVAALGRAGRSYLQQNLCKGRVLERYEAVLQNVARPVSRR
jgi:colanic acid biosynthesis glycosyl transferase WcaI